MNPPARTTARWRRPPGLLRYLWAAPASALGLLAAVVALVGGAKGRVVDGVLEVAGGRLAGCGGVNGLGNGRAGRGFVAITFGHIVLGTGHDVLAELRAHEHEHVRQYEQWGALFFVAYLGSGALEWLRGRHPYWHNPFERRARAAQRAADDRRNALAVRAGGPMPGLEPSPGRDVGGRITGQR